MKRIKSIIFIVFSIIILSSCKNVSNNKTELDINALKKMSKLATLECRFNNVALIKQPKGIGLTHVLEIDRKAFIEYDGVAKIGIDFNELKYNELKNSITIPKPIIISTNYDTKSLSDIMSKDGLFNKNKISEEVIKEGINNSLKKMQTQLESDTELLNKAQLLAKDYIENFVRSLNDGFKYNTNIEYKYE